MRKERGITLIALIITIVILIILTAVTISNVMNSNLFGLAKGAAENYIQAGKEEQDRIDKLIGALDGSGVGEDSKVKAGEIVTKTEKDNYTDVEGRTATIPAGFKVSTKPDEQYIEDGLVIQDEQGNEFVWVPCYYGEKPEGTPNDVQAYKEHEYTETEDTGGDTIDAVVAKGWKTFQYTNFKDNWFDEAVEKRSVENGVETITKDENSYGNKSVKEYGGFYVGRYEAGWPDADTSDFTKDSATYMTDYDTESAKKNITTKKPVSKANVFSWNFINQPNSKTVSEKMYDGVTYNGGAQYSESVQSKLVDGTAWDTITNWIANNGIDVTISTSYGNYLNNSKKYTGWYAEHIVSSQVEGTKGGILGLLYANKFKKGSIQLQQKELTEDEWTEKKNDIGNKNDENNMTNNYFNTLIQIPTGSYEDFKLKNIYDLAGNMWEWTTEVDYYKREWKDNKLTSKETVETDAQFAVVRSGCFDHAGMYSPFCSRFGNLNASAALHVGLGFRVVLYIK